MEWDMAAKLPVGRLPVRTLSVGPCSLSLIYDTANQNSSLHAGRKYQNLSGP